MRVAPLPANEISRLQTLKGYDVLDTLPERALDDLAALAAHVCGAPMSLISLVDERRQWFKARMGLAVSETPRDIAFCAHAILEPDILVVPDAANDDRFADNPLVAGEPHVRFYAGAPLVAQNGHALGALCVLDNVPRTLSESQVAALLILSRQVMTQLELRRQTRDLRESEERLSQLFAIGPVSMSVSRLSDRKFLDINEAFARWSGWSREEAIGKTTSDLGMVSPEASGSLRARIQADGGFRDQDLDVVIRSGDIRRVIVATQRLVVRGEEQVLTTFIDVTESRQAAEAIAASEAQYRTLFDHAPDGILISDRAGYYLDANEAACRMFGRTRTEFIGLHAIDIVAPPDLSDIKPFLDNVLPNAAKEKEWQLRRSDGTVFTAETVTTTMPDGSLVGVIRDVTEKSRTNNRFRRLIDSNLQGVMFWNKDRVVTSANDLFLKIVGFTRSDLEQGLIQLTALTPPEFVEITERAAREIALNGFCAPFEKEYLRRDGTRVPILIGAAAFEDNPTEGFAFVIDCTERKKLEQQFLRAQRMESIGTLAGGIAHDLNNVLGPILMATDLLREDLHDPDHVTMLDTMRGSALRGAALVQQILTFARGVEGRQIAVNPIHIMHELVRVMRDTFPKSIDVRFPVPADLWTITGDPSQIHQVLMNLCVNARDAMPEGGALSIAMSNVTLDSTYASMSHDAAAGDYVLIQVADSGSGMAASIRERIFEPFFTTKELGKGTGLGLSTSLAIVQSHGGFINVYSEPGDGTTFKVYFPADRESTVVEHTHQRAGATYEGNGALVLVVDDEDGIRTIMRTTLERFGYRVILARNGAEAVAQYAQHRGDIAVVVTDMAMPVMDGPAMIVALMSIDPGVKIIASSGLASNASVAKAVDAGVSDFIPKPYTAETLLATIDAVLRRG